MFETRGDFLYDALIDMGFGVHSKPEGAFYLYASCAPFGIESGRLCRDLLERVGVAVTPGLDFGHWQADSHVRFAFTTDLDCLREGTDRIRKYLHV